MRMNIIEYMNWATKTAASIYSLDNTVSSVRRMFQTQLCCAYDSLLSDSKKAQTTIVRTDHQSITSALPCHRVIIAS